MQHFDILPKDTAHCSLLSADYLSTSIYIYPYTPRPTVITHLHTAIRVLIRLEQMQAVRQTDRQSTLRIPNPFPALSPATPRFNTA